MSAQPAPNYLAGYPAELADEVRRLIEQHRLAELLLQKYPLAHEVRTDKALYDFALALKNEHLRNAGQLSLVCFDSRLQVIRRRAGNAHPASRGCREASSRPSARFASRRCSAKCRSHSCA